MHAWSVSTLNKKRLLSQLTSELSFENFARRSSLPGDLILIFFFLLTSIFLLDAAYIIYRSPLRKLFGLI